MEVKEMNVQELKLALDSGEQITLLDVREEFERQEAHIGGHFIPLAELPVRWEELPKDSKLVVYCRSGGRSAYAIEALQRECGFQNLYNLSGGMLAWIEAGFPTER